MVVPYMHISTSPTTYAMPGFGMSESWVPPTNLMLAVTMVNVVQTVQLVRIEMSQFAIIPLAIELYLHVYGYEAPCNHHHVPAFGSGNTCLHLPLWYETNIGHS